MARMRAFAAWNAVLKFPFDDKPLRLSGPALYEDFRKPVVTRANLNAKKGASNCT